MVDLEVSLDQLLSLLWFFTLLTYRVEELLEVELSQILGFLGSLAHLIDLHRVLVRVLLHFFDIWLSPLTDKSQLSVAAILVAYQGLLDKFVVAHV